MKCYFIPLLHPVSCIHILLPASYLHTILHWILNWDWRQWLDKIMCWELRFSSWNCRFIFGITWVQISARISANLSKGIFYFTQALQANSETNLFTMLIARLAFSKLFTAETPGGASRLIFYVPFIFLTGVNQRTTHLYWLCFIVFGHILRSLLADTNLSTDRALHWIMDLACSFLVFLFKHSLLLESLKLKATSIYSSLSIRHKLFDAVFLSFIIFSIISTGWA
jgi:hypothetical protein